jgi:LPXTG-motif cell wall-anchored protein
MKTRLGAILAILLGVALIVTGTTSGGASVGVSGTFCGSTPIGVTAPGCPRGHISIHKVVSGSGTLPAAGWTFTIDSSNCALFPGSSNTVHIAAAGGTVDSDTLYSTEESDATGAGPACDYTVTETAVAGWTTTYSPTGVLHLGQSLTGNNDVTLTVTNTAVVVSTTPPTSAPATSTAPATVATSASASASAALANTGSKDVKPATYVGIALVVGGVILLFASRRRSAAH